MKNFNIIQSLCRASISVATPAIEKQIDRLASYYEKEGMVSEAEKIRDILENGKKSVEMSPSNFKKSFLPAGEILTKHTQIPVDKETSTPLAEVFFSEDLPDAMPLFDDDIKRAVFSVVNEWKKFDKLSEINAQPSKSCLIFGKPGTGKTHLAKWLAKQTGLPVVLARLDGLVSSFLGTSSRNIGNLFAFANKYQCILLLDEFDAIAKLRNDSQEVGEVKRVVNTLLQCLDTRKDTGFTIGVTNHEGLLDPAIWRRFDIQIEIPLPSLVVLKKLIESFLKPLTYSENEMNFLAWCMDGASGADIKSLSNWLKRVYILEKNKPILDTLKEFSVLNSGRMSKEKKELLNNRNELLSSLLEDRSLNFKQKDVAEIFNIAPSSVSKHLSKLG
ncbi:AAA family ATPase [Chryseobacterium oryctis]|uniref:ATP-binding protein n=1 Tax=Chryseobacterium oryctis TaxID=2952618 RepID=A0ABT3HNF4_9FLAO|nr:ATP-binding protein [Chryseobacterium oryctis]MCW3161310.1 ATP-binding protein [Chryseobacterium oryctis]